MFILAELFGVDNGQFLHWSLAVGLTLLVLDVLFCTEYISWLALAIFSLWGTLLLVLPAQWSALVFMGFLAVCFVFYYTLWVQVVKRFVMGYLNRKGYSEARDQLAGSIGEIRGGGDTAMVKCGDELLRLADDCRAGLSQGDRVRIMRYGDGKAYVEKLFFRPLTLSA